MAKVKGPLLSLGASGQIAETLVYFPWKGLQVVRTYVIPSNPNTSDQQTQRGYFGDAVDEWHTDPLDADDVAAWNRRAGVLASPQSGFNAYVGDHIDIAVSGETPEMGYDGSLVDDADGTFTAEVTEGGDADAVNLLWGVSPTSLINTDACAETANTWDVSPADAVGGQTIYGRFELKAAGAVIGYTGIFRLKVAVP